MSNQKKRNFQIEAFKHRVVVDPKYAEKTWNILEHAIHEIYNHNASGLSFEELYRHAFSMVLHKFGDKLYSGLVTTMTSHLKVISKSIEDAQGGLLEELHREWDDYNEALETIEGILMYLDKTYIPSTDETPVHELGMNLWRDNIIRSSEIQTRLFNTLLELVHEERTGEVINRGLMRNIIKMLTDLGSSVYQGDFEGPFLQASAEFYRGESQKFIECCDCGDYLKKAERRLNEEMERVTHYLDAQSKTKITNVVVEEMIANHTVKLIKMENSGLVNMLLENRCEDLRRMYALFGQVQDGLLKMTSRIRETYKQLFTNPERLQGRREFARQLLDEKNKYDNILKSSFKNDKTFQKALNSSFEDFINLNVVDEKLHEGLMGVSEDDGVLKQVMMFFQHDVRRNTKKEE